MYCIRKWKSFKRALVKIGTLKSYAFHILYNLFYTNLTSIQLYWTALLSLDKTSSGVDFVNVSGKFLILLFKNRLFGKLVRFFLLSIHK